jgi:hypothetical protein
MLHIKQLFLWASVFALNSALLSYVLDAISRSITNAALSDSQQACSCCQAGMLHVVCGRLTVCFTVLGAPGVPTGMWNFVRSVTEWCGCLA